MPVMPWSKSLEEIDFPPEGGAMRLLESAGEGTGTRLYVQKDAFDKVVDGVWQCADKIRLGIGFDPACGRAQEIIEQHTGVKAICTVM